MCYIHDSMRKQSNSSRIGFEFFVRVVGFGLVWGFCFFLRLFQYRLRRILRIGD